MAKSKVISVYLPDDLIAAIDHLRIKLDRPRSNIVRTALWDYLKKQTLEEVANHGKNSK